MNKEEIKDTITSIKKRWTETPDWVKKLAIEVLETYGKHIYNTSWTSGCCTEVYPITLWRDKIDVQLNTTDKRHFSQKRLDEFVRRFPQLEVAYFCKNDGSCPAELVFRFKERLW